MNFDVRKNLGEAQVKTFNEFKEQVIREHGLSADTEEPRLLRFLKARDFDIPKARTMLRNNIAWRKKHDIDNLLEDYKPSEAFATFVTFTPIGVDREGGTVCYVDYAGMDVKGLLRSGRKTDFLRTAMQRIEGEEAALKARSHKEGKLIDQWTFICDFENYSLLQVTHRESVEALLAVTMAYDANYPERLKTLYVINTSVYFTMFFAILKPFLSDATLRKLVIFGKDGWREKVSQLMDQDSLPAFLGGKKTDPDGNPRCHFTVKHGGTVPEKYFLPNTFQILLDQKYRKFNIPKRSFVALEIDVIEPGSEIEWEFETRHHDISFEIKFKENGVSTEKSKELLRVQRIDASTLPGKGSYSCEFTGTYILVFDNSFSIWHSKELYCRANLVKPSSKSICVTE